MSRAGWLAVLAAMVLAASLTSAARAGEWQYDPATDLIYHGSHPVARWGEHPSMEPERHYRQRTVPSCPHSLCGYPIPIYKAQRPMHAPVVRTYRVRTGAHEDWCAWRYRSYDVRSDTFQPHHGPRRYCRSPYR
ncbi:MAG: BA14K family protein [Mesorhizobium sp.]|nr:BA14K family protein [Mesorhizobium sp.]